MIDYRNIPLEAKKREIEDYRKLLPQAKSIYDQPKEFVYKIDYDAKHDTADVLREFYQASDDPSSRIKQQGAAQIVKLLNPEMDPAYIERNIGKLIEASVGQKLDYENTFDEFVSTFKSSSNDLRIGAKYMDLYIGSSDIFDTEEFEAKKSELLDEVRRMPAQKRTDYMPLALLTDMLVSTGNILPSSLPSVGMYLAGGVVNAVAPGLGTLLAKAGSSSYAGFQEAGGTLKTLVDFRDSEGNQLSDEAVWTITQMVWAGVTAVNWFTDPFEKMFSTGAQKLASRVITKESVKGILKSGNSSVWKAIAKGAAKKGVMDVVEGVQEMAEDLVDILAVNAGVKKYNEEYDTDFTTTSYEEAKKELAATFKETTKGMFFMSLPGNVTSTFKNINSKSSTAMRDANKVSGFTKDSQVISPSSVVIPKSVKGMDTFKESAGPIEVVKVGDSYIPTNKNDASFFASIKEKNTKGVNVVVKNQTGESTTTASVFAENIADKLALGWKDNAVVFKSAEDAKKAAEKFAINSQGRVTGYTEANGVYTVSLESNGEIHDIVFTHKNNITDYTKSEVREDSKPTPTNTEQTTNNAKDIKGVARKFNTADSKKLQKQIKKAMPRLSPNENKIAAAMFGMMAEAQDMTIDEFLEANYKNGQIFGSAKDGALEGFRGYVEFGDDLKAVIYAAEHSDFSTFSHETFHVAFRSLGKQAEFSQIIQDAASTEEFHTWMSEHGQLFEDNVFKDVNLSEFAKTFMDSEWSNTHEEFLARVFEGYLSDGKSLSPKLKPLLAIISDWFKEIYHSIKHTVDLDSRIVEAFDSMLDKDTKLQVEARTDATADTTVDATTDTARESTDTTGKPTILFQEAPPTDSEAFKKWFGDSKVVDDNGDPLVMYHGTDIENIRVFDTSDKTLDFTIPHGRGDNIGTFFTAVENDAKDFGGNAVKAYLNLKNPMIFKTQDDFRVFMREHSGQTPDIRDSEGYIVKEGVFDNLMREKIESQGYDGVIIEDPSYSREQGIWAVAFDPTQIKSVNNRGTWDKTNPNILFQPARPVGSPEFKAWFGDSKVVDRNGKPLEVYHGTDGSFDTFNNVGERLPSLGYGYYFTPDIEKAKQYGSNVMPVYLNSEKVLDWGNLSKQDRAKIIDRLESKVPDSAIAGYGKEVRRTFNDTKKGREEGIKFFEQKKIDTQEYFHEAAQARTDVSLDGKGIDVIWNEAGLENASNHDLLALAQQYDMQIAEILGYDAARFGSEIVVFSNNQIKSVNNEGTWNSADPNILHQGNINSLNQVPSWQRSQVEKVYKNNKRFMKDLYGNKTNMTEFDWIGTRTNNFRLWFGDWLDEKIEDVSQVQSKNGDPRVMFIPSKTGFGVEEPGYEVTANGSMVEISFFPEHASETAMEMEADTASYRTYEEMVDYKWEMKAKHSTQLIADYFGGFLDDEKVDKDKLMKQMEGVSWKVGLEMVKKYGVPDVNESLKSEGAGVMPVYVNARNIFIPSEMFDSILSGFLWKYDQEQMSNEKAVEDFRKGYSEKYRDETIIDYLKELGFDGILMQDNYYDDSASIGVFHMSQIKSTFNDGAFDSKSTDILHQPELKPLSKNSKEYKETKKRVQDMLENKEYPKDHELALFKGEEWADKEISFRRLYAQDDMLVSKFEEAYDAYIDEITSYDEKTGEEVVTPAENENKRILEILHEQDRTTFDNIEDSIGDTESFIGRMKQQIELMTPKVADQGFKAALSDDSFVLEVASMLTGDLDPTQDSGISKYLFRLANDENPSGHTLRYARKALIDNVREYRRMIYEMDGETAQLSYERAIEGTEIGEGVESLGVSNTEVKNLLNSELSEEIRTMIEENIATDTTLTAIIEDNLSKATSIDNKNRSIRAMSDNIAEINERIAEITAELEQQADETASLDEGRAETLQKLKDKSKALSRAKADLKRVKIARDALKTKAAIKKITSKLDVHAKDSVNTADARMTSLMQKFLSILRTPNPKGIDYRILLKNIGVEFDTLPGVLKSYFVASDDVLLLKSTLSNMSIDEVIQLEKDMKEMKAAARHLLTERKEKSRSASNWVKTEFYSQRTGEKFATVADYHDYVDNLKYESGPKTSKSKESQKGLIKSMFETNLLTGSRWVRRIDGKMDGAVSKWIFGGELEDGTVWKGVEGVIDQELKRSNERVKKVTELMRKEGLTDKHMIGKFKIKGEPVVMRGQTITNQRAIAVYIYDQQKKGKVLLRSLDGNGFTNSEVKKIIDNLTESQKKLGDFMIEDFASVRGEVEETYYKVNNKILGWEDNYFPLVGTGDNARFSSVLESNQGKPSGDPRHTFTEQRTGEIYKLNLDVVTSWASMVKQQEHYIAGAEYFSQTQNLMNKHGGDLYSAISETKGPVYAAKLQEFIDGLADHKTALDEADSAINAVRNNLIVARLGFNIITALKQIPSFGAFAMEYGPVELAKAFIQVGTNYKGSMELINEMAPQIKYRSFTSEYQALMNIEGTSQYKLAKKGFAQFSMGLIKAMDKAVVNTLWIGSYNNSIARNLSPEMAAMKATKFINDTQPTGNFKDNAMLYSSNSPIWKFLLMFTNQLNKYLNIAYDIPFELKEHMFHQAIGSIVSLGINTAGIVLLSGGMLRADGDDDDEYWKSVLGEIQGTMLSIVPVVGPLVAPIVKNQYFPDTSMPMVSELAQLWSANKVEDPEKRKERIEKALINMGFGGAEVGGFAAGAGKKIYKSLTEENIWYLLNSAYGDRMGDL